MAKSFRIYFVNEKCFVHTRPPTRNETFMEWRLSCAKMREIVHCSVNEICYLPVAFFFLLLLFGCFFSIYRRLNGIVRCMFYGFLSCRQLDLYIILKMSPFSLSLPLWLRFFFFFFYFFHLTRNHNHSINNLQIFIYIPWHLKTLETPTQKHLIM